MRKLFILLLTSLTHFAAAAIDSPLFQGSYECSGKEIDTEESFKLIMILEKTGTTYSLHSRFDESSYYGTGIVDDTNKNLSVAFTNPVDSKETGVIIFHARNNNKLQAIWTYLGKNTVAHASCKKIKM